MPLLVAVILTILLAVAIACLVTQARRAQYTTRQDKHPQPGALLAGFPDSTPTGGASARRITLGVCNVRGWVKLCEALGDQTAVAALNRFHASLVPVIRVEGGTVVQLIGDTIFFAVGIQPHDAAHAAHADRALRVAQSARTFADGVSSEVSGFHITLALVTGDCILADLGSPGFRQLTVLGDPVNRCFRLSKEGNPSHNDVIIAAATVKELSPGPPLQANPPLTLPGFSQPVETYTLGR